MNQGAEEFGIQFEQELEAFVHNRIYDIVGPDNEDINLFLFDGYKEAMQKAFKNVEQNTLIKFNQVAKTKRLWWPLNDKKHKPNDKFIKIYTLLENYIIKHTNGKENDEIELAGGRPFSWNKYDDKRHGDVVTRPDIDEMSKLLDINSRSRTIYRYIEKIVKCRILIPLETKANQKGMYIIGTWKAWGTKDKGGITYQRRISEERLREDFRKALIKERLLS